jgi:hypothetical protein
LASTGSKRHFVPFGQVWDAPSCLTSKAHSAHYAFSSSLSAYCFFLLLLASSCFFLLLSAKKGSWDTAAAWQTGLVILTFCVFSFRRRRLFSLPWPASINISRRARRHGTAEGKQVPLPFASAISLIRCTPLHADRCRLELDGQMLHLAVFREGMYFSTMFISPFSSLNTTNRPVLSPISTPTDTISTLDPCPAVGSKGNERQGGQMERRGKKQIRDKTKGTNASGQMRVVEGKVDGCQFPAVGKK